MYCAANSIQGGLVSQTTKLDKSNLCKIRTGDGDNGMA